MAGDMARWLTLSAFCYNAFWNAAMFMNFVSVSDVSSGVFGVGVERITLTYSVGLFTTLPCAFIAAHYLQRRSRACFGVSFLLDALGAWLRWLSVYQRSFALCLASTVCIGGAAAIFIMAYALVGERWFREDQRFLATSIGVQSNYAGWCLGALLIPTAVHTAEDLARLLFAQAVAVSLGPVLFVALHDESAARPTEAPQASLADALKILVACPRYLVQIASYSTLGAVSFAIPGVQDVLFSRTLQLSPDVTKWLNFVFIASGVASGLVAGWRASRVPYLFVKVSFVLASISLVMMSALLTSINDVFWEDPVWRAMCLFYLFVAMAIAGAASLGFLGVALALIADTTPGVGEAYTAGAVEWFVQLGGALLTELAFTKRGFICCTILTMLATALLVLGMKVIDRRHLPPSRALILS